MYIQALLGVKVEPKEALEEVKKEEELENLRWGPAVEEEENERKWAVERERRMALDYYVNMALTDGGVPKNCGRERKRNSDTGHEGGGREPIERKPRKPRKPRARSLKSKTAATMVGGPKEFGGTKAFKPLVQRYVIVSFGPPKSIVLSLKFHVRQAS